MAKEAGMTPISHVSTSDVICNRVSLERFAKLVAEHEREECVKVVQEWLHGNWHNQGVVAALMIRERGAP
jgi:hypothetical protein